MRMPLDFLYVYPAGFCAATGDPHYESFDGFRYSFQGQTQYVLAKYANDFEILVQNIDCGEDGVTCTKAVEIRYPNVSKGLAQSNVSYLRIVE